MEDLNKLSIESWEQWFTLKVSENTEITDKELLDTLVNMPDSDKFLAKFQELQLAKKREQYEKLQPAGFEHAPEKAKKYRQELKDADDVEQMKYLSTILTYNQDNTVGLPTIKETFCADLAWWRSMNRKDSVYLAKSKWYHLLSDLNACDSETTKQSTDWYRLEKLFWKYSKVWALFCMLGFDNNRYWTATKYKNEKWEELEGVVRDRLLNKDGCHRGWDYTINNYRVCGFKDSM